MQEGGLVPEFEPPESGEVSDLLGSLSDYTLPSEAESIVSDIPQPAKIDIEDVDINYLLRTSTDESIKNALDSQQEGEPIDLQLLKPSEKTLSFKPRGLGVTDRSRVELTDLWDKDVSDFSSMIDSLTVNDTAVFDNRVSSIKSSIESKKKQISVLEKLPQSPGIGFNPNSRKIASNKDELKSLQKDLAELKNDDGSISDKFIEDYRPIQARKWIENYVKENVALSEEEWESTPREEDRTYEKYLGDLEKKIHSDLLFSKDAYDFTQALGMDGVKLHLEGGIELGERNNRFKDAELSWRVGVNELAKTVAATSVYTQRGVEFVGGAAGDPMFTKFRFTMPSEKDKEIAEEALLKFDEERNARIFELQNRQTQYAVTQKQIEQFGANSTSNEVSSTEEYASILNDAKFNLAFKEGPLRAIESMPLSLSAMGAGLLTLPISGGSGLVASLTTGGLIGVGVTSRTFYDSYSNPLFYNKNEDGTTNWDSPNITETQRHGMATMHGLAEGTGEFIGMMTTMGIGRFVKAGGISPYNIFKDAPTVAGASKYSAGRKLLDYGLGLVYGSGLGATEEYVAEGFTGVTSMFVDSYYSGEKYTSSQYIERFHKDGYIGAWAGAGMGSGAVSVSTARAQYERVFRPETFNDKAAASYYHQLTNSGFFMNGKDRATRKELNGLLQIMAKETAVGGRFSDLTEEQQETVNKVNELISDLDYSKNRNIKALEQLADDGRYDLLAEMVIMDNNMLFFEAMSTEFSKNDDGLWENQDGDLVADPTGLEMYDMNTNLSKEKRKEYKEKLENLKSRMELFQEIAENNYYDSPDYVAPVRRVGVSDWRNNKSVKVLSSMQSNEKGDMEDAPTSGIMGLAAKYAQAAKGKATVILHKTRASLQAVGGTLKDNALFIEATPEQKENGRTDEIHIFAGEGSVEAEVKSDLTHEFGHFIFEDILKDDATRERIASEIFKLADKNENLRFLVEAVRERYSDYEKGNLEREIINRFMESVAQGGFRAGEGFREINMSEMTNGFENWGMNILNGVEAIKGGIELGNADSAIRLASKFSKFNREQQDITARGVEPTEAAEISEQQEAVDAALASRDLNTSDLNAEGPTTIFYKAEIENESLPRFYTQEINDYGHFKNLYSYKTGNGDAPGRMIDAYYMKGGKRINLETPEVVLDRRTGEKRNVNIPFVESYSKYTGQQRLQESKIKSELSGQWSDLTKEVSQLYGGSDKKLNLYTQESDFEPSGVKDFETVEGLMNAIESLMVKRENIQALIDSDMTREELVEIAGGKGKDINKATNPEIFNMSGRLAPESFSQRSDRLNEEIQEYGAPWQLLPKDSPSYEARIPDLRLATQEELEYAAERMERLKDGEALENDLLDVDLTEPTGLASRELKDALLDKSNPLFETEATVDNIESFLRGEIKSGRIGSWQDLKELLRGLDIKPLVSLHNIDRTLTGEGSLPFTFAGKKFDFNFYLSGGPHGAAKMSQLGSNVSHSNTRMESSSAIETNAMEVLASNNELNENRPYLLGLALLTEANSLKNPKVFTLMNQFMSFYLDSVGGTFKQEKTKKGFENILMDSFNEFFNKRIPKSVKKRDPNAPKAQWEKVIDRPRATYGQVFARFSDIRMFPDKDIDTSNYGMEIKTNEGLRFVLDYFSNLNMDQVTKNTTFNIRGKFLEHFLGSRSGLGPSLGFPSKDEFLDAINQPEYKGVETGSVVNLTSVDVNKAFSVDNIPSILKVDAENTENTSEAAAMADNMAYEIGVLGHKTVIHFDTPAKNGEIIDYEMKPRQGASPLKPTGLGARRLPGRVYTQGNSSWEKSTPTKYGAKLERFALRLQDKYSNVMLLQQDIEVFRRDSGKYMNTKVPQSQDFEMAMDNMYGMLRTDFERLENEMEKIDILMEKSGLTAEQVSDYLYAKHAPERNDYIKSKRPEMLSGSGMTTEDAEAIINELETPEMIAVSKLVYGILANTRKTMVEGGLEKASTIETYEGLFNNYVPLNGLAQDEMENNDKIQNPHPTGGAGMAIYGRSTRAAKGRESKTGINLIANVIMQNAATKQRARKDQAMLALYNLVKNNPNLKVWDVYSSRKPRMKVGKDGKSVGMNVLEMQAMDNMVPLRINGEQHFIYFKKVDYANALNGETAERVSFIVSKYQGLLGFMRNSYTQYNPGFFVGNFFRDLWGSVFNSLSEVEREGGIMQGYGINSKKFTKDIIFGSFTSLRALLNESALGREMNEEMKEYLIEWEAAGGRTGYSYSETINNVVENMRLKAETKSGFKTAKDIIFKKPKDFFKYIAAINEAFENSIRLSAYIEARKVGVTKQRAAQLSKNITINFNKSGELTPTLNGMYLFFNASVQGATRFGRTFQQGKFEPAPPLQTHEETKESIPDNPDETPQWKNRISSAQKLAAGHVLVSALVTMVNIALSDREDDDELSYNKIAEYKKERGFNIMYNGKNYFSVPLGYGFNMFHIAGMLLAEVATGQREVDDAAMFMALSSHSSFSPIAFGHSETVGGSIGKGLMPSVGKAWLDAFAFNETYFGGQVYREQLPFGVEVPRHTLSFRSPEFIQQATKALSDMTEGTENIDAGIDWNADPYYYIMQSYWGGAGDFVEETGGLTRAGVEMARKKYNKLASSRTTDEFVDNLFSTPEEDRPLVKFSDVPILKTIYGGPSRFYDFDLFDKNRKEVEQYFEELKDAKDGKLVPGFVDFEGVKKLKEKLKDAEEALRVVWDARKKVKEIEDFIDRSNAMYMIQEAERQVIMQFNKDYYDLRGQYLDPKPEGIIPMDEIRQLIGTDE